MSQGAVERWWVRSLLGCLLSLSLLLVAGSSTARQRIAGPFFYRFASAHEDSAGWALRERPGDGWTEVASLVDVPQRGGASVWVAAALPAEGDSLHLPRTYLQLAVYVDGEPVARDDDPEAGGRAFRLVDLPARRDGAWLTVNVWSAYSKTGIRGPMHIGKPHEHLQAILRDDTPRLVLVLVLVLVSLLAGGVALQGIEVRAAVGLAGWALAAAVWSLFYSQARDLWLPDPRLWVTLWAASLSALTPFALLFFQALVGRKDRSLRALLWITAVGGLLGVVMRVARISTTITNPFLTVYRLAVGAAFVAVAVVLVRGVRRGDRVARVLAAGYALLWVFGLRDVLVSLSVITAFDVAAPIGLACLVAAGAVALVQRIATIRHQRDAYARALAVSATEREMMLHDLHDGLGRINTGIGMLAEVAKRQPDNEKPLDAIGGLAREGRDEIRAFMHGLDAASGTWPSLAATLRERLGEVVEATGGRYRFELQLDDGAAAPTPLLDVHLLRVAQEGVNNALKHADEPEVVVGLVVTEDEVTLSVQNDAVRQEPSEHGVNLGAGLGSMRARARALGGELTLDVDDGEATLRLRIPLPLRYASADGDE